MNSYAACQPGTCSTGWFAGAGGRSEYQSIPSDMLDIVVVLPNADDVGPAHDMGGETVWQDDVAGLSTGRVEDPPSIGSWRRVDVLLKPQPPAVVDQQAAEGWQVSREGHLRFSTGLHLPVGHGRLGEFVRALPGDLGVR